MRGQPGFFDIDVRLRRLSDLGDRLEAYRAVLDFGIFRSELLGLQLCDRAPDARTIWLFRGKLDTSKLLYPRFEQLDLTGSFDVLARFEELTIHLVWKTLDPVSDVNGLRLMPTETFANCRAADILFVPGGPGQMEDTETPAFLRRHGEGARYATAAEYSARAADMSALAERCPVMFQDLRPPKTVCG